LDADAKDSARVIFAAATALLEDAAIVASRGQSPALTTRRCHALASSLVKSAEDLAGLARALEILFRDRG
jgi:hypothetical protein